MKGRLILVASFVLFPLALTGCAGSPQVVSDDEGVGSPGSASVTGGGGVDADSSSTDFPSSDPKGEASTMEWEEVRDFPARPLAGGTVAVDPAGSTAVAVDPDGSAAYFVDLGTRTLSGHIEWVAGGPGPVAVGDDRAFVLLQHSGELAALSLRDRVEVQRARVCSSPEGVAVDGEFVHVSCRGGQLVTLRQSDLSETRRLWLDDDLRDVVPFQGGLAVSRLREAEVLFVDEHGALIERYALATREGSTSGVLWKMRAVDDERLVLAHQVLSDGPIGTRAGAYYSGALGCGSIAAPVLSVLERSKSEVPGSGAVRQAFQNVLAASGGTLDVAPLHNTLYTAVPGNALRLTGPGLAPPPDSTGPLVQTVIGTETNPCAAPAASYDMDSVPVAVAAVTGTDSPTVLVQTLEPASIVFLDDRTRVSLHDEPRLSTGLRLFQMTVGSGLACASCHPLGRADAQVWNFAVAGPRRTQSLEGGVSHLGAFHWDGEFADFSEFVDDVMTVRMGLDEEVPPEYKQAFLGFLDGLPRARVDRVLEDEDAPLRGRALFVDDVTACATCHSGPAFTDNRVHDVGTGGFFVTPPLRGLASRLPILHDGCATTIRARFGLCGGGDQHGVTSHLTDEHIADLVAYLETL